MENANIFWEGGPANSKLQTPNEGFGAPIFDTALRPSPSGTARVVRPLKEAIPASSTRSRSCRSCNSAQPGNRRFWRLSALRAHPMAPYKADLRWETLRRLTAPGGPGPSAASGGSGGVGASARTASCSASAASAPARSARSVCSATCRVRSLLGST